MTETPATPSGLTAADLAPGTRVQVTQQIPRQTGVFHEKTEGTVVKTEQRKTGSWFAHAKDDKLWLDRLTLRKDDGEIVVVNIDPLTHIDRVEASAE